MTRSTTRTRCKRGAVSLALIVAHFSLQACYIYLPEHDLTVLRGQRANVALTDSGSVVLAPKIGPGITDLEGVFQGDSTNGHILAVYMSRQRSGAETDWKGEHVMIPQPLIASIQKREFSASRTAFVSALGTAGFVALTLALRGRGEGGQGGNPIGGRPAQ